jgi:hypothetical protein
VPLFVLWQELAVFFFSSVLCDYCLHHDHFDIAVLHEVFPLNVDAVFAAIFTDSSVQRSLMARRHTRGKIDSEASQSLLIMN